MLGSAGDQRVELGAELAIFVLQRGQRVLELGDFGLERLGGGGVAFAHRRADQLRGLVAAALRFLRARATARRCSSSSRIIAGNRLQPAPGEAGVEGLRVLANGAQVVHGRGPMLA